jgi:hypothetical protein
MDSGNKSVVRRAEATKIHVVTCVITDRAKPLASLRMSECYDVRDYGVGQQGVTLKQTQGIKLVRILQFE